MTANGWVQILVYFALLTAAAIPLGWYMARVYLGRPIGLDRAVGWLERGLYRLAGVDPAAEMTWRAYAASLLTFNAIGLIALYLLQRCQGILPFNPQGLPGVAPDGAFNTAASFASNTNWQSYAGEATMSHLVQASGLAVQNFLSAATGMAVLVALIRGLVRRSASTIGNWWVDLVRSVLYILLPLSTLLAIALVWQGVPQNWRPAREFRPVQSTRGESGMMPMGPVASQVAIKQLGTNGGGFFNANTAHPFENPTPLSNLLEMLAILLIPAALCLTYGEMVGDRRQGWALLAAMAVIFVPLAVLTVTAEQAGNPALAAVGIDELASDSQSGGNMEGKESRFGIVNSALWAAATTAASNGSVNSMHDSFTPLGGLVPMGLMQLGEVIFGGVGSGLYGMLTFLIVAVFVAGLMVGRTPEYLGKKIEAFEMKMASLTILIPPLIVLIGTAFAVVGPGLIDRTSGAAKSALTNPGPHGFSEVLYAFSSAGNNNGSAFAGLSANTPFYNGALGVAMLIARYWLIVPVLALAGSLARKKYTPPSAGTLPTHTLLFVVLLVGTVLLVGALTFVPALALGPIAEELQSLVP